MTPNVIASDARTTLQPAAPNAELAALAAIAEAAGRAILAARAHGFQVAYQSDHSPPTQADTAAHQSIVRGLAQAFPGVAVLSEEAAAPPYAERARLERLFIVDPLDGTKEFVKDNGEFCVCIALAEHGYPALGAVHVPMRAQTYAGGLGLGAFRRDLTPTGPGPWRAISVRQPPHAGLIALASRSHPSPEIDAYLALHNVRQRITAGSALKFCLLAEGQADLYPRFNPTHEWDTAAGQAVLEGAGGSVLQFVNGEPGQRLAVNTPELLNGPFLASARAL